VGERGEFHMTGACTSPTDYFGQVHKPEDGPIAAYQMQLQQLEQDGRAGLQQARRREDPSQTKQS
jgi:hypothetical protein